VLSKDTEFAVTGNITQFDYRAAYNMHKKIAEKLSHTSAGHSTYTMWNDIVFKGAARGDDDSYVRMDMECGFDILKEMDEEIEAAGLGSDSEE
jgi:hypothetical protein